MKKGTASTVVSVTLAVLAIWIIFKFLWPIIDGALYNSQNDISYLKFQELVVNVQDVINEPYSYKEMTLDVEGKYSIFSVYKTDNKESINGCKASVKDDFKKPDICREQNCLCLTSDGDTIECMPFEGTLFFTDKNTENNGCPYELGDYSRFHANEVEGFLYSKRVLIFSHKYEAGVRVYIMEDKPENLIKFYNLKECPQGSDQICDPTQSPETAKIYHKYEIPDMIQIRSGGPETFSCILNESNKCQMKIIQDCEDGQISDACACGDYVFEEGYCSNGRMVQDNINNINEICLEIEDCESFNNLNYAPETIQFLCEQNPCRLSSRCSWNDECKQIETECANQCVWIDNNNKIRIESDGKQIDSELAPKIIEMNRILESFQIEWAITEAFPPKPIHKSRCHYDGTCIDANFRGVTRTEAEGSDINLAAARIVSFIQAAQQAGLRAVYEVKSNSREEALESTNAFTESQIIVVPHATAAHFSVYNN